MTVSVLFDFERDFVATLRCIPMSVRFKLDLCGVKLSLRQWSRFTSEDRHELLMAPCDSPDDLEGLRARLNDLVALRAGETMTLLADAPHSDWAQVQATPDLVTRHAKSVNLSPPTAAQWASLSEIQRFVLVKLTRDNHDNINFGPALREFGLAT